MAIGVVLVSGLFTSPASAQATRTWVSGVGDDVNPCSRTAPCKTFAGAISKTAAGGIINCIDPGGFGQLTITKSIEIDCLNTKAGVLSPGTNAISVITAGTIVVLRGLSIEGVGTGLVGVNITAAATVHIEKSTIRGFRGGNASAVRVSNTSGNAQVNISDSNLTDSGAGVLSVPSAPAFTFVELRNVNVNGNSNGVANAANSRMRISHAVFSGNTTGILADPGSIVTLNDTDIVFSNTGINGATTSFGNNRIAGSLTSDGTAPTAAGPASTDLGQK
jgi:hypothetical protein